MFCHTKHTSESKMPYTYLKKHGIKIIKLVLPHQTHLGTKNALFLPKKRPIKLITLVLPHQTHLEAKNALFSPKKTPNEINYPWFATPTTKLQSTGFHSWKQDVTWNPTVQFSSVQFSSVVQLDHAAGNTKEHLKAPDDTKERRGAPKNPKERQRATN